MRPVRAVLVLSLVACGSATPWGSVEVVDETTEQLGTPLFEGARAQLTAMAAASDTEGSRLRTIAYVDWIEPPAHDRQVDDPPVRSRFLGKEGRVEVNLGVHGDAARSLRHGLCHALDDAADLSPDHADWLDADAIPPDLLDSLDPSHGDGAAEVFAAVCSLTTQPRFEHALDERCGTSLEAPFVDDVHRLAFPAGVVDAGPPVDLTPRWLDVERPSDLARLTDVQPIAGEIVARFVHAERGQVLSELVVAVDPDDGTTSPIVALPDATAGRTLLPSDGQVVLLGSEGVQSYQVADGALAPLHLPEARWTSGVVHDDHLVLTSFDLPDITVVELSTGTAHRIAGPEGSDAGRLFVRDEGVVLVRRDASWRLTADGWEHRKFVGSGPMVSVADWTLLADGAVLASLQVTRDDRTWGGLAHVDAGGRISVDPAACEPEPTAWAQPATVVSDGDQLLAVQAGQLGIVRFPAARR